VGRQRRHEPFEDMAEDGGGMDGGKGVRGERENDSGPEKCGPPGAEEGFHSLGAFGAAD